MFCKLLINNQYVARTKSANVEWPEYEMKV